MIAKKAPVGIAPRKTNGNEAWTRMEKRGDFTIVLAAEGHHTATVLRRDYHLLYQSTRQLEQWARQLRVKGKTPALETAKRDFAGTILIGDDHTVPYVTDDELQDQIHRWDAPSVFAKKIIALRWKFTPSTVATIVNRKK